MVLTATLQRIVVPMASVITHQQTVTDWRRDGTASIEAQVVSDQVFFI
jgi:hypothetical protein